METKKTNRSTGLNINPNVLKQLKIIKRETGCTHNELLSCLLYKIGVDQSFLSLPNPLTFAQFKEYVKHLRKAKKMQLNR